MLVARRKSDQAIYPDFQSSAAPGVLTANAIANGFASSSNLEEIDVDQQTFDNFKNAAYGAVIAAQTAARTNLRNQINTFVTPIVGQNITGLSFATNTQRDRAILAIFYILGVTDNSGVVQPTANWLP